MIPLGFFQDCGIVFYDDGQQVPAHYSVHITRPYISVGCGLPPIPGRLTTVSGQVWTPSDAHFAERRVGETEILQMADGSKMRFFFTGGYGHIALKDWIG